MGDATHHLYRVSEAAYAIKRQKLMQESPGTKEDPIYLSMFDWCKLAATSTPVFLNTTRMPICFLGALREAIFCCVAAGGEEKKSQFLTG